jgi:hypothetical protein
VEISQILSLASSGFTEEHSSAMSKQFPAVLLAAMLLAATSTSQPVQQQLRLYLT